MDELTIRTASADEFAIAIDWAAAENWNPGLDDLRVFYNTDPNGFLMGFCGSAPVSSISVVRYGNRFGFLGFYIVVPERRGQGIGIKTWYKGLAYLNGRTIGLDGVVDQLDNYRKSGFILTGRNIRFSGIPRIGDQTIDRSIRQICRGDMTYILTYDRPFFPDNRDEFLKAWIDPESRSKRMGFVAEDDGRVIGYGVIRNCRSGYKIGPLLADDEAIATSLFSALCSQIDKGEVVSIDVPEKNVSAVHLAEFAGLFPAFETARMYRGTPPTLPLERTYGITTFELG